MDNDIAFWNTSGSLSSGLLFEAKKVLVVCKRGHREEMSYPFKISAHDGLSTIREEVVCRTCFLDALRDQCGARVIDPDDVPRVPSFMKKGR